MILRTLTIAATLVLFACAGEPTGIPTASGAAVTPEAAICAASGGAVRPVCRMQRPMCVAPYKDAGKVCTDDAQCQGGCLYEGAPIAADGMAIGACRADNDPCGCVEHVVAGKRTNGICVD